MLPGGGAATNFPPEDYGKEMESLRGMSKVGLLTAVLTAVLRMKRQTHKTTATLCCCTGGGRGVRASPQQRV